MEIDDPLELMEVHDDGHAPPAANALTANMKMRRERIIPSPFVIE
jgi:hypothetical protein